MSEERAPSGGQTEAEFLAGYDLTRFDRPSVAVDVAVLTAGREGLRVVVYRRTEHPALGRYALPGGFVRLDESLEAAAARLLRDKTGLERVFIEQVRTFGEPGRDPRGRIIAVGYYALVHPRRFDEVSAARGATAAVVRMREGKRDAEILDAGGAALPLAFDHGAMLGAAVERLRDDLDRSAAGFQLLPPAFTLRALQDVHEAVRGEVLNKDSFRRRLLAAGVLEATGKREQDTQHRPAELYRFARRRRG